MQSERGPDIVKALAARSDVLVENFRGAALPDWAWLTAV
jgi:crotonobetainyl-CoA:carnitine CoA-transferase CaiB-like acyl-CoA transferase